MTASCRASVYVNVARLTCCAFYGVLVGLSHGQVTFEWKIVDDLGNSSMLTSQNGVSGGFSVPPFSVGTVNEVYTVAKHEVSNAQYAVFLNAVASQSDPYGLFNSSSKNAENERLFGMTRTGTGPYTYAPKVGMEDLPVNFVSVLDVARFVNWLHNGQGIGDTEDGAYDMLVSPLERKAGAAVFIPNEDEWHKAAYYDPRTPEEGGPDDDKYPNYWRFPTQSNDAPVKATLDSAGNITNAFSEPNVANWGPENPYGLCKVMTGGIGTETYYGVMHMGGNVVEWNESRNTTNGTHHDLRGGDWANNDWDQQHTSVNAIHPTYESTDNGIRLAATVPFAQANGGATGGTVVRPSYADWAETAFAGLPLGDDDPKAAPTEDADNDGASNLCEYANSTDPMDASERGQPVGEVRTIESSDYWCFRYRRWKGGDQDTTTLYDMGDLVYRLEHGDGPASSSWLSIPAKWTAPQVVTDHGDGTETVEVQYLLSEELRHFSRITIEWTGANP